METLTKEEFILNKNKYLDYIRKGAIFIYPTDTIYGIGCNAQDPIAVHKIRQIKQRPDAPFSIIAPSKSWIQEFCELSSVAREWIEKLPGPYTLILPVAFEGAVAEEVTAGRQTLGVRIPQHWISQIIHEVDIPIVTTSVNVSGREFLTSADQIDPKIKEEVDFLIDEGSLHGNPSTLVNLAGLDLEIIERK